MYIPAHFVPNDKSIVERKLTDEFGQLYLSVPFDYYEEFADQAQTILLESGIKIDLIDIMENPLVIKQFVMAVQSVASEVRLDDLEYVSPKVELIYQAEINEAKRLRDEAAQEAKRIAVEADEAKNLKEAQGTTSINVLPENEAKARAILSLAGLL